MDTIASILQHEIEDKIIICGVDRISACLDKLSEEQIHYRPNSNSNSVNNQILHLDGNVRQWFIASLSEVEDKRERKAEFDFKNKRSKSELKGILNSLKKDILAVIPQVERVDLVAMRNVQCYTQSYLSIIIHVIEHFSYHVGQITYITKMILDVDTGYYEGDALDQVN